MAKMMVRASPSTIRELHPREAARWAISSVARASPIEASAVRRRLIAASVILSSESPKTAAATEKFESLAVKA